MTKIQSKQIVKTSIVTDVLAVTDNNNTISTLSQTPSGEMFMLVVNGVVYMSVGQTPPFTLNSNAINWNTAGSNFDLSVNDSVIAIYTV